MSPEASPALDQNGPGLVCFALVQARSSAIGLRLGFVCLARKPPPTLPRSNPLASQASQIYANRCCASLGLIARLRVVAWDAVSAIGLVQCRTATPCPLTHQPRTPMRAHQNC